MKTIKQLLDLAKKKQHLPSDNQLALKLGRTNITQYRTKGVVPDDTTAIRLAELCDLPPELVVSICHLAKAKTPEESNLWQHIYKMASAACLVLVMSTSIFTPNQAQASSSQVTFGASHFIHYATL